MRGRWLRYVTIAGGVITALALAFCLYAFIIIFAPFQHRPPMTRDLHGSVAENEEAFDRRLKQRFPAGYLEYEMLDALRDEGFELELSNNGRRGEPYLRWLNKTACGGSYYVGWTADDHGRLEEIHGHVDVVCS